MNTTATKTVETLVGDIYTCVKEGVDIPDEIVDDFGKELSGIIRDRLSKQEAERPRRTLRMSNLGKPDRQLWYEIKSEVEGEDFQPYVLIKFLYGHILEALLLFLARAAGHEVTAQQAEVDVDGIRGHIDAIIDGVVVDVKSTSSHSFKKFKDGSLAEDDPFGYMEQLAGYSAGLNNIGGAFLAIDKQNGHVTLHNVPPEELEGLDIRARIAHLKTVVESDEIPDRCYEPVPEGQSGNMKLAIGCQYCSFKDRCWADANNGVGLRTFHYSQGPRHFVHIEREPQVPELTF